MADDVAAAVDGLAAQLQAVALVAPENVATAARFAKAFLTGHNEAPTQLRHFTYRREVFARPEFQVRGASAVRRGPGASRTPAARKVPAGRKMTGPIGSALCRPAGGSASERGWGG